MPIPRRTQIRNPGILFKKNATGPYANRLRGKGVYGKAFPQSCIEYHFLAGDRIDIPGLSLDGRSPGRISIIVRADDLSGVDNQLFVEGVGGDQNTFRLQWFAANDEYRFRAFTGDNTISSYVEPNLSDPREVRFIARWQANSGGSRLDTRVDDQEFQDLGLSGISTLPHTTLRLGINASLGATSQFYGVIKDVRLFDAFTGGNMTNHWKIDDNAYGVGAIRDSVGGKHGDLIQGAGDWQPCEEQGAALITCPICADDVLGSERDLSNWTVYFSTLGGSVTGCDGTELTSNGLIPQASGEGQRYIERSPVLVENVTYRVGAYAKAGAGSNWVMLLFLVRNGATGYVFFDLGTGAVGSVTAPAVNANISLVSDGWYDISFEMNANTGGNTPFVRLYASDGDGDFSVGGDGSTIWHYQDILSVCPLE